MTNLVNEMKLHICIFYIQSARKHVKCHRRIIYVNHTDERVNRKNTQEIKFLFVFKYVKYVSRRRRRRREQARAFDVI